MIPLTIWLPTVGNLGTTGVFLAEPISNFIGGTACFVTMMFTVWRKLDVMIPVPDRISCKKRQESFSMLNYLWAGMILIGIVYASFTGRIPDITNAAIDSSKEAVSLCITMMGVSLCGWD